MTDQIEALITSAVQGKTAEAEAAFNQIISQKAASALDELRTSVINKTFNNGLGEEYSPKNPKFDIYHQGKYVASTNWSPTAKHAKEGWMKKNPTHSADDVKVSKSDKQ